MRELSFAFFALAASVAVPASVLAPALSHADPALQLPAAQTLAPQDRGFVDAFTAAGLAAIEAGTLATQRAGNAELRRLGSQLAADFRAANRQLADLLAPLQLAPLPEAPDAEHKAIADQLGQLKAHRFDRLYLDTQRHDHRDLIALLELQLRTGDNRKLQEFAAAMLPTLHTNLQRLTRLAEQAAPAGACQDCPASSDSPHHPSPPAASGN
jgi:predicted outer membrane protein